MAGLVRTRWWAGVDWSEQSGHEVAVVNAAGVRVASARVADTPEGVREVLRLLAGLSRSHRHSRKQVPVAIETSRGLLVAALREAGQPVVHLNPAMVARYRGRLTPTQRRKSDRADALLLANILRTDGELHRALAVRSDQISALNAVVLAQWRARRDQRFYDNRLRSQLSEYFPAALEAWRHLPGKTLRAEARAVLAVAPTPGSAARLPWSRLAQTLADAGRTRQVIAHADRLHALFRTPALRQRPPQEQAMGQAMLATLGMLNRACDLADELTEQIGDLFAAHPMAPIYRSFPGVGPVIGARLLAEIGDDPDRFQTARGLRAYAGAAPLTWASGSSSRVTQRRVCNKRLKTTGHHWAFAALTRSPGARAHYDRRRQAGDRYAAALRHLYGRMLTCLHHCTRHGETYLESVAFPLPPSGCHGPDVEGP